MREIIETYVVRVPRLPNTDCDEGLCPQSLNRDGYVGGYASDRSIGLEYPHCHPLAPWLMGHSESSLREGNKEAEAGAEG